MTAPAFPDTAPPGAADVADVLLAAALGGRDSAITVEPSGPDHEVCVESSAGMTAALRMPRELGDAVAIRIALLAGIDVAANAYGLGTVAVALDGTQSEVLVLLAHRRDSLTVELRRARRFEAAAPSGNAPRPGALAARVGPYRLLDRIGEGGTGTVYRAEHVALGKLVAIKVLHREVAENPKAAVSLLREGRLAARAESAGVVGVTDFGMTPDGRTFLVMELCAWPTLAEACRGKAMAPERALAITRNILVALDAAHAQGVVHRDLKPENVFLGPDGRAKIGDFGAAKLDGGARGREVVRGKVFGSPLYMSPEQCRGEPSDRRSDLYAVGCMLYEMLAGTPPYSAEQARDVLLQHVGAPIPEVTGPGGPLPDNVRVLVRKALAKNPAHRHATAADMLSDIDRCARALDRGTWRKWLPL